MHQLDRLLCKTCFIFRYQKLDRFSVLKTGPFFVPAGPVSCVQFAKLNHSHASVLVPFSMPKKGAVVVPVGAAYGMQFAKLCWFPTSFVVPFTDSRTDRFLYNASWFCCHTFRKVGQPLAASSLQIPHARAGAFWVAKIGLSDTMKFDHFNFQARNMRQCGTRKLRLAHAFLSYLDVTLPLPTPPHICSLRHAHSSPGLAATTHHVPLLGGVGFFSLPHQSLAPSGTRRPPPNSPSAQSSLSRPPDQVHSYLSAYPDVRRAYTFIYS